MIVHVTVTFKTSLKLFWAKYEWKRHVAWSSRNELSHREEEERFSPFWSAYISPQRNAVLNLLLNVTDSLILGQTIWQKKVITLYL